MNTGMTWQTDTTSSEETEALARSIGARLRGGEVIELRSDLGGGKTTFVRGLAVGMGSTDSVASPSFTISKMYHGPELDMHHYDFYRLPEAGLMSQELAEVVADPHNVTVVEWAEIVEDVLPTDRIVIQIVPSSETGRTLIFSLPTSRGYLIEEPA